MKVQSFTMSQWSKRTIFQTWKKSCRQGFEGNIYPPTAPVPLDCSGKVKVEVIFFSL